MIVTKDNAGETRISYRSGTSVFRLTGAGKLACGKKQIAVTGEEYRLVLGEGARIEADGHSVALRRDEGVLLAPSVLYTLTSGESATYFVDFVCAAKLFDGAYCKTVNENCARIETLIEANSEEGDLLRLTAAVAGVAAERADTPPLPPTVQDVRCHLDKYYYLPCNVSALAEAVGYSRGYFTARFTAEVGCSPYKYVTRARIRAAVGLLTDTDLSVRTVSAICGYESVERLCEMFRKETGSTPLRYRKTHKS